MTSEAQIQEREERLPESADRRWSVIHGLIAVLGAALVLWVTRFGPGTSGDSTSYLMGAENLMAGNGFSRFSGGYEIRPISGFPPFYSMVLAAFGLAGFGLQATGRILNAGLFALSIFLGAYLVYRYSQNGWAGLMAGGLILTADSMLLWHSWIMSEALYIGLLLAGLAVLLTYFEDRNRRWPLAVAGLTFAAAALTRYIGLGVVAAAVVSIVLIEGRSVRRKLVDAGVLATSGLVPVFIWLRRNAATAGTMTNRELALHPLDPNLVRWYLAELSSWFVPHEVPFPTMLRAALALGLAGLLVALFFWSQARRGSIHIRWPWVRPGERPLAALPWVVGLMIAAHLGVLAANSLFLDASTSQPAVARYLTPVFVLLVIFGVSALGPILLEEGRVWGRRLGLTYGMALVALYFVSSWPLLQNSIAHMGYTAYQHRWREVVTTLQQVGPEQPILSNNPELVYVLADRPAYARPIRYDHYQEAFREDFESQLRAAEEKLEAGGVYVVFHPVEAVDEQTLEFTGAEKLVSYDQATFYGLPEKEPLK